VLFLQYVVQLLEGPIDAGFIAHPTNVWKEEMERIKGPLFIAAAGTLLKGWGRMVSWRIAQFG
jgi:hypothetical protein